MTKVGFGQYGENQMSSSKLDCAASVSLKRKALLDFFSPSFNVSSPPSRGLPSLYVRWEDEYRKTDLCHGSKLTRLSMLERSNPHVILHVVWAHLTTAGYCKGMRGLKSQSANISWGMRMRA